LLGGMVLAAVLPAVSASGSALASSATGSAPSRPASGSAPASETAAQPARPVVLIGIPGLRWSDISATATPALWRLAETGSVGSLVVTAVQTRTCPADAWLTLNGGARATVPRPRSGPCPPLPAVALAGAGSQARVASLPSLISYNRQYHYDPDWGLLATAAGQEAAASPGECATAIGPGAALALAGRSGRVGTYRPGISTASRSVFQNCPLTVADLGALPAAAPGARPGPARARALRTADRAASRVIEAAPAGAITVVAGLGDDLSSQVRAIIVSGPGYRAGELASAATRHPGLTLITDLTPSVLHWRGRQVPATVVGSQLTSTPRGPLAATIRGLTGQDTAAQVYRATIAPFFLSYGFAEGIVLGLLALVLRGNSADRRRRRTRAYRITGIFAGSIPAGTFLASLVPWWLLPHPAVLLYGMALAWAAVIAAVALAGPWRRDPFGPPGFVGAVTIAVIGLDVMTGSHLQLGTPFGLSVLTAGRFYGVGNNALGVYGIAGILAATWAGGAVLRSGTAGGAVLRDDPSGASGLRTGTNGRAVAAVAAVALFAVTASGWPAFGAKVGGTIAMAPAFLVLLAAVAGLRINARRAAVIAVSGAVLVLAFALVNYFVPGTGPSDIGAFVGHVLHGGAGGILQRKVGANVRSLTLTPFSAIPAVVVIVTGLMLAWPARFGLKPLAAAYRGAALLRPALTAMWLIGLLGWLADDSGVTVAATALPLALPISIVIVSDIAYRQSTAGQAGSRTGKAGYAAADPGRRGPATL
jgi:hypothetical protein